MGDLGSDVGGSSLSLMAKVMEALLKLLDKLYETWKNAPQRKKAALEYKMAKEENQKRELIKEVDGSIGMVEYEKLKKSGEVKTLYDIPMTKEEMHDFADVCKRRGIHFAGVTVNVQGKHGDAFKEEGFLGKMRERFLGDENARKSYYIAFRSSDAEQIKDVVDLLNKEKLIRQNEANMKALMEKGEENWTPEDRAMYEEYKKITKEVQKEYCDKLNDEQGAAVVEKAVNGKTERGMTLEEALNRNTGRLLDKDEYTIVADAQDPAKYIRCHGYQEIYRGKPYIKTTYEVFHGSKKVFETHDGRFDGRPEGYWKDQIAAIAENGQFFGTVLKFQNIEDYHKFVEELKTQNEQELNALDNNGIVRDYDKIAKVLNEQLERDGAIYRDGAVLDKETGKAFVLRDGMTDEEMITIAEAVCIGKQLENYDTLKRLDEEIAIAKTDVLIAEDGSEAKALAEQKLADIQEKYKAAESLEQGLNAERKCINAIQSEQEVSKQPVQIKAEEIEYLPEDKVKIEELEAEISKLEKYNSEFAQTLNYSDDNHAWTKDHADLADLTAKVESMKGDLEMLKAEARISARAAEKQDDRRDERVNDLKPKDFDMKEVQKELREKQEARASQNDVRDRQFDRQKNPNVKEKASGQSRDLGDR